MFPDCPVPPRSVRVVRLMVFVNTITLLQANVTLPPPASAVSRLGWSQVVTVPWARAELENDSRQQRAISSRAKNGDRLRMGRGCERVEGSLDKCRFPQ